MTRSQDGARISWFQENSYINEYLTSKFLLLLIFTMLSPLIRVWPLFLVNFGVMMSTQNFKISRERFHRQIIHLKVPFTFDFHFSINIGTWNTNLNLFDSFLGWWRHHTELKLQNFEVVISKANTSSQFSLYYWLSSFYHHWNMKYKFVPFLTQFWVNDVTTRVKTAIFLKDDLRNKVFISEFQSFYWFQSFYHSSYMIHSFGSFLPSLEAMTSVKK